MWRHLDNLLATRSLATRRSVSPSYPRILLGIAAAGTLSASGCGRSDLFDERHPLPVVPAQADASTSRPDAGAPGPDAALPGPDAAEPGPDASEILMGAVDPGYWDGGWR